MSDASDQSWRDLFRQDWWLDAVAPGEWSEVVVRRDGRPVAHLPFVRRRRAGLVHLGGCSPLTPRLGPWVDAGAGRSLRRLSREKELLTELIGCLPPFHSFNQACSPQFQNWLPFYWTGFQQTTRYTYVLEDLSDIDSIWRGISDKTRNTVRKGAKTLTVRDDLGIEQLLLVLEATFSRRSHGLPFEASQLRRVYRAASDRDAGRVLAAVDDRGDVHAGVLLVWDRETAYYLLSGATDTGRRSGATSVLLWEAIRRAAPVARRFDFEGSMVESIEKFFRGFGAQQTPYHVLRKATRPLRLALAVRDLVR